MSQPTLYQILGVNPDANTEQIRDAYRSLARQYHPDYNPGDSGAEGAFKAITRAYEVLSDPTRRARYDKALESEKSQKKASNGAEAAPAPIKRNETLMLVVFGIFLLLAVVFFFIDPPRGVFFLVIAVALELRNSIEAVRKEVRRLRK